MPFIHDVLDINIAFLGDLGLQLEDDHRGEGRQLGDLELR